MLHQEWVTNHLRERSQALGFVYTPKEEIHRRLARLREKMILSELEALLIVQKVDCFYFSGTAQNSVLFVPLDGHPLLAVRRELDRARVESPIELVVGIQSIRELPSLIQEYLGKIPKTLGIEMDILPAREYLWYCELFSNTQIMDSSQLIGDIRTIKSPFEVELMRRAGEIGKTVYHEARSLLREGMTEIEFGGIMEAIAKKHGHEGLLRVRGMNYEAYTWHVLSGWTGGIVSQSDSPMGGLGLSPIFPVGASHRKMNAHEPILVDFGTCYHGYLADETRMFSIGELPGKFQDAYKVCREIHDSVLAEIRPGIECDALFKISNQLAERMGYKDSYLGPQTLQTRFIGHGIGLELSEKPFLAEKHTYPLEEGMTLALEPKIVFPGEGAAGIENTVVITANGYQCLTPLDQDIFQV